jgi:hypothetical protein
MVAREREHRVGGGEGNERFPVRAATTTSNQPCTQHTHTHIHPTPLGYDKVILCIARERPPACRFVRRTVRKLIIISICDLFINTDPSAALAAAQKTPQFIVSVHAALLQKLTPPRCALLSVSAAATINKICHSSLDTRGASHSLW